MSEQAPAEREPDYRFTLANERTYLAWIRTSLGLLVAGVAVGQLATLFASSVLRAILSLTCVLLAVSLASGAYLRWNRVQRAIRRGEPLPKSRLIPTLTAGVLLTAVLALVAVLVA